MGMKNVSMVLLGNLSTITKKALVMVTRNLIVVEHIAVMLKVLEIMEIMQEMEKLWKNAKTCVFKTRTAIHL